MRGGTIGFSAAWLAALLLATGCGRTWPTVHGVGDVDFLAQGGVGSVDVLPMDLAVTLAPDKTESPEVVAERFELLAAGEVQSQLVSRGYQVAAFLERDGMFERGDERLPAMSPELLDETEASLAAYGGAQARTREVLLTPYLPARLGEQTGSDATLYVGGWGFVGDDPGGGVDGGDVAKVIVIALFIVVIIAVVAAVAKGGRGGGGGGGGKGGGGGAVKAPSGGGGGGGSWGRAAGNVGGALRGTGRALRGFGRALGRGSYHFLRGLGRTGDAWGRSHTHIEVWAADPTPNMPWTGKSRTFLEMTLVDNRRGLVLWHARQEFPADPGKPGDVRESVNRLMAGLPRAR